VPVFLSSPIIGAGGNIFLPPQWHVPDCQCVASRVPFLSLWNFRGPVLGLFSVAPTLSALSRHQDQPARLAIGRARPLPITRFTWSQCIRERSRRAIDRPRGRGPARTARVGTCSGKENPRTNATTGGFQGTLAKPGCSGDGGSPGWLALYVGSRRSFCSPRNRRSILPAGCRWAIAGLAPANQHVDQL
jgi:hypothetical protein